MEFEVRSAFRRFGVAMILSWMLLSAILSAIGFVLSGFSELTTAAATAAAVDSALILTGMLAIFTFSLALAGVVLLVMLGQQDWPSWAATGIAAGAFGGVLLEAIVIPTAGNPLLLFTTAISVALFLLIRAIARLQAPADQA